MKTVNVTWPLYYGITVFVLKEMYEAMEHMVIEVLPEALSICKVLEIPFVSE